MSDSGQVPVQGIISACTDKVARLVRCIQACQATTSAECLNSMVVVGSGRARQSDVVEMHGQYDDSGRLMLGHTVNWQHCFGVHPGPKRRYIMVK